MDENLLLTAEILSLSPDLYLGQRVNGAFVVKNITAQTYLTVDACQWGVLSEFAQPQTVPAVLEKVIRDRTCPALSDFYELILKAYKGGILRNEQSVQFRRPAIRWFIPLPMSLIQPLAILGILAAIGIMGWKTAPIPAHWQDIALGWLLLCGCLSLGYVIAASVLKASGAEIYQPHLRWQSIAPHFAVDLRDAFLERRSVRLAVDAALILPLAITVIAGILFQTPWAIVPVIGLILQLWPLGEGFIGRIILLCRKSPRLDTEHSFIFRPNTHPIYRLKNMWRHLELVPTFLQHAWGIAWTLLAVRVGFGLFNLSITEILTDRNYWEQTGPWIIGAAIAIAVLFVTYDLRHLVLVRLRTFRKNISCTWKRWRKDGHLSANDAIVNRFITENPLLRRLEPHVQAEFARHLKPYTAKAWSTILSFDEEVSFVGIIVSGSATVYRRLKTGRKVPVLKLAEGDLFGVHGLIDPHDPKFEVCSNTPIYALVLPSYVFQSLVIEKLGAPTVFNICSLHVFLKQSPLCTQWSQQAIARFAQITQISNFVPGEKIIHEGEDARALYIVYEGSARVLHGVKQIGRVKTGEYLGEIGLLQNSAATADVEVREDTRCLVVDKVDFMRFMAHNYNVALQVEHVCSKRLGKPIFPLAGHSFDTR